jgi:hypothetical protein
MSGWVRLFALTARHGCHGDAAPPIGWTAAPETARMAAREGLVLRARGATVEAFAPEAVAEALTFVFRADALDPALQGATAGLAGAAPQRYALSLDAGAPAIDAGSTDLVAAAAPSLMLGVARLALGPDDRDVAFSVRFPAAALPWTYVVTGLAEDVQASIRDSRGEVSFAEAGAREMARGQQARLFRSDRPIPLSVRPDPRFALLRDGPYGPRVAMRPLPAPALGALDLAEGVLGASIHVNL